MPGVWCKQGRLREDSGLTLSLPDARRILDHALDLGFARAGFVDPDDLGGNGSRFQPPEDGMEWNWVTSPEDWRRRASILVCCLSCRRSEPDDLSTPDDPHGLIAPFARRN